MWNEARLKILYAIQDWSILAGLMRIKMQMK